MNILATIKGRIHTALAQKRIVRSPTEDFESSFNAYTFCGDAGGQDAHGCVTDSFDDAEQKLRDVMERVTQLFSESFAALGTTAHITANNLEDLNMHRFIVVWNARGPIRWRNALKAIRRMEKRNGKEAQ